MRFPTYPDKHYGRTPRRVIDEYVRFYGEQEPDNRDSIYTLPKHTPLRVAMEVGRGCLIAANGDAEAANRMFRRAQSRLSPHLATPERRRSTVGRMAQELYGIAHTLEVRGEPAVLTTERHNTHLQASHDVLRLRRQLGRTDDKRPTEGAAGRLKGQLVQRAGLAAITRLGAHPWVLAMPALLHHDTGPLRQNNFDMLLIETAPYSDTSAAHKIQIKAACLGVCADPQPWQIDRSEYAPDIRFLSGCCDLGLRGTPEENPDYFAIPDMMTREAGDTATPDDIRYLDRATGSLMLALTTDNPLRMGTAVPLQPHDLDLAA